MPFFPPVTATGLLSVNNSSGLVLSTVLLRHSGHVFALVPGTLCVRARTWAKKRATAATTTTTAVETGERVISFYYFIPSDFCVYTRGSTRDVVVRTPCVTCARDGRKRKKKTSALTFLYRFLTFFPDQLILCARAHRRRRGNKKSSVSFLYPRPPPTYLPTYLSTLVVTCASICI